MLDWRTMVIGVVCLASCSDDGGSPTESEAPDDAIEEPGPAVGPGDDSTPDQPGEPDGEPGDDTGSEPEPEDTGEPTDGEPGDDPGSDSEAETSPHGAVSLEVLPGCAIEAGVFNFPDGETPPVSATDRLESWSDGEAVDGKEISVDCAWAAGRITITIGDRDSDQPRNVGMSFTAAPGEVGSGTLRLQAPELPQQYGTEQGGQQCEFSLFELDAEAGSVWGRFSCPAIVPDVGDPREPEPLEPVNVPGSLLAYDAASERAIVVDYRSLDTETTAEDCYENEAGWFEYPDGNYDEDSIGTCHSVRQTLRLVAIEDGRATVVDSHRLDQGEHVAATALGDDRLFIAFSRGYYGYYGGAVDDGIAVGPGGYVSFAAGTAELLVLSGIRANELSAARLSLETGDSYGGVNQLVAHGEQAVVATGWRGSLSVIDASDPDAPRVAREVAVSGYVQNLEVVGNRAVAALGCDGVITIELD